ncbi:MAG: T9SS type A sorting domain-containing protein [Candidatus Latescibacteria bacterium]|nr:T9SS type A sorting domain-containing protein [bacterium]MBD3425028.1 T9SS type A sorting domain-containing protein [Candidatus Latescibacterota bacterium]
MHVSDITVGRITRGRNLNGTANVLIVDAGGVPVEGATVYGFFNAPNTNTMTSVTGSDGVAYFETPRTKDSVSDFCFEVTDVTLSGGSYDSAANAVTRSCESGDVFSGGIMAMMQGSRTPDEYGLMQNHPNPFNPVTVIRFNLPEEAHVKLEVYDVQGRLVKRLVNRTFSSGFHAAEWNATGVSSGVYFYRLVTPTFTEMKKMILLR